MLPRLGSSKLVSRWLAITLAASIVAAIDGGLLAGIAGFAPSLIWQGQVWRLVTWVFVEPGPWGLIFTLACIYRFGGDVATRWGDRRLRRFMIEVLGGSAVVTTLLGLISAGAWGIYQLGGWAVGDALVIAWARQYPDASVRVFYGMVTLRGRDLILAVVGVTVLYAVFLGPFAMALELLVCAGAYYYPPARLARRP
jgi:membrane associated rhomboid family serine protease